MNRYTVVALKSCRYSEHYAVRVGGSGGRVLGRELGLDRDKSDLLRRLLEQEFEAGRNDALGI